MNVLHAAVRVPLVIRGLTEADLPACAWSGDALHLAAMRRALLRVARGEVDYLAACLPSGAPVAVGGVDFAPYDDAGYLWQLAVDPALRRCGIGTRLVRGLEDRITRRGRNRAELLCEADDARARAFCDRLGYGAYDAVACGWDARGPGGGSERHETTCLKMRRALPAQAMRP